MRGIITRFILPGLAAAVLAPSAFAGDWPQWLGPTRDAKVADFKAPAAWPKELTKKWSVKIGDGVATPALVGGKLYTFSREGGDEVVRCLDAGSGKEVWQEKYEAKPATGPAGRFPGPRCSPAVADGKVVTLGVQGTLSCFDAATGKEAWRKDDFKGKPMFFTSSSPIIVGGTVIAQLGGQSGGGIAAYELADGKEKWKWTGDGPAYASPVLMTLGDTKVLIAETNAKIVGLNAADGKQLWETSYPVTGGRGYNASTPIAEGQTVFYSGSNRGAKAVKFEKQDSGLAGKELWNNPDTSVMYNTPVVKNGFVFGLTSKDSLFCINAESGKTAWTAPLKGAGGYGSIVDAGSVLFALTPAGQLVVYEPSDKAFKEIASYKVGSDTYAYPIVTDKGVYVKDKDSVALWAIE